MQEVGRLFSYANTIQAPICRLPSAVPRKAKENLLQRRTRKDVLYEQWCGALQASTRQQYARARRPASTTLLWEDVRRSKKQATPAGFLFGKWKSNSRVQRFLHSRFEVAFSLWLWPSHESQHFHVFGGGFNYLGQQRTRMASSEQRESTK